jgi:phage terminase large subunit-like protein
MNYIIEYNKKIHSGEIVTSNRVKKIYEKLVNEIDNPSEWHFDSDRANKPIEFIEQFCRHSKGEWIGQPIQLDLFQKAYIQALFGFIDDSGNRRFKESFFLVARKNGKSTLLSSIMLYMLVADGEGGAEVVSGATKKEQASIVFKEAVNMISQSEYLRKHLKKRKTDIYFPATFSTMNALSSDSNTLDGLNLHCAVIDELHAIKDRNLYEVLKQGMSARRQPLLVMITTAGTVRENIYDDIYGYAIKVADGIVTDERFLPIIYELDNRDEWTIPEMWMKANPSLGTIKKYNDLVEKVERAKTNPQDISGILTKDFNIRETITGTWMTFDDINNEATYPMNDIKDSYAIGGVDLSATTDLTCATLLVMKPNSEIKYIIQQYFIPSENLERKINEDKVPFDIWHKQGLVTITEGNRVDYSDVTNWFIRMVKEYGIRPLWVGYDSWNAQYFTEEMKSNGFNMVEVRQGFKTLSTPMKELQAELTSKRINYNNNPILKWNLSNVATKGDENGNIRPVKNVSSKMRIDGAVSLLIAYTVLTQNYQDYKNMI